MSEHRAARQKWFEIAELARAALRDNPDDIEALHWLEKAGAFIQNDNKPALAVSRRPEPQEKIGVPLAALQGFSQVATSGLGDEIAGLVNALFSKPGQFKQTFETELSRAQEVRDRAITQQPGANLAGGLVAGALQGGGLFKLGAKALPALASPFATLGARVGAGGAVGAALGGAAGAGFADKDRLRGAAIGAAVGAPLGAIGGGAQGRSIRKAVEAEAKHALTVQRLATEKAREAAFRRGRPTRSGALVIDEADEALVGGLRRGRPVRGRVVDDESIADQALDELQQIRRRIKRSNPSFDEKTVDRVVQASVAQRAPTTTSTVPRALKPITESVPARAARRQAQREAGKLPDVPQTPPPARGPKGGALIGSVKQNAANMFGRPQAGFAKSFMEMTEAELKAAIKKMGSTSMIVSESIIAAARKELKRKAGLVVGLLTTPSLPGLLEQR